MSFWGEVKFILFNPNFQALACIIGVGYGIFVAVWSTMQNLVGGDTTLAAYIGITMVSAGIVGSLIAGLIIDKYRNYRFVLTVGAVSGLGALLLFFFGLPNNRSWLIGSAVPMGFFLIALLPIVFEAAGII